MTNNLSMDPATGVSSAPPGTDFPPNPRPRTCLRPPKQRAQNKSKWKSRWLVTTWGLLLIGLIASSIDAVKLDSPAKIQRHKSLASLKQEPKNTHQEPGSRASRASNVPPPLSGAVTGGTNELAQLERVRRTNDSGPKSSQTGANSTRPTTGECPPGRLLQGLLPVEYLRGPQRRAYCDCKPGSHGWQVTCHSETAASGRHQATHDTLLIGDPLPNQLHPAFRAPQIQRQQQQAAAAAAAAAGASSSTHSHSSSDQPPVVRQLVRRSPLRWEPAETSPSPEQTPKSATTDSAFSSSASAHEGFGDDLPSSPGPAEGIMSGAGASSHDAIVSQPSSASYAMAPPPGQQQASSLSADSPAASNRRLMSESITQASSTSNSSILNNSHNQHQQHLSFQPAGPVLFSVKYVRNIMIEIDCDQAEPQYKPAMFQGKSL